MKDLRRCLPYVKRYFKERQWSSFFFRAHMSQILVFSRMPVSEISRSQFESNLVYYSKSPDKTYNEDYVGKTDTRIEERIMDHNKLDKNSHLLKNSRENNHQHVWENDFEVLGNNYRSNFERKSSGALFIKQLKPSLKVKEKSIQLQLYNWFTIPLTSTCLKLTIYTVEQHILCCSWFYHVKFGHVNVYRDIT